MKKLLCGAVLILAACGSSPDEAPAAQGQGQATAAATSAGATPQNDVRLLLDKHLLPAQSGQYAPQNECGKLPGAAEFRERLAEAVVRGDAAAIAALADSDIKLGFGGDDGRPRFLQKLKDPEGGTLPELKGVLSLGCAVDESGGLTMPWFFAQDMGDVDAYDAMLVTGVDVPLQATADPTSAVTRKLSWDMVSLVSGLYPEQRAQRVKTADGKEGYIATDKLRSLLDYRLLATKVNGEWRITAFLAGD